MRSAFSRVTWNTGSSLPGDELMTRSTSEVAANCSSASSRSRVASLGPIRALTLHRLSASTASLHVAPLGGSRRRSILCKSYPSRGKTGGKGCRHDPVNVRLKCRRSADRCLWPLWVIRDVANQRPVRTNVRFTPESGHSRLSLECPLSAKSGHRAASLDYVVGARCPWDPL